MGRLAFIVSARAVACLLLCVVFACPTPSVAAPPGGVEKELEELARVLRSRDSAATYGRLVAFARRHEGDVYGARAALALGYRDLLHGRQKDAEHWFVLAERDPVLREYAVFWAAQAARSLGHIADAIERLESFRRDFLSSAMTEQAVEALASNALDAREPQRALFALEAYEKTPEKPALLLLRARARELDRNASGAAQDYLTIYYRFPLSLEARSAGERIPPLSRSLGRAFPEVTAAERLARAEAFYQARRWKDARAEFERIVPRLSGADRERARLRTAQCRAELHGGPKVLDALKLEDAEADAERLYSLALEYRSRKQEAAMVAAIERAAARAPRSAWAAEALFLGGNYFWMHLDRARAAGYYRRVLEQESSGPAAVSSHYRLALFAYLEKAPETRAMFEEHLRRFPGSTYTTESLYWLGRNAERAGDAGLARAFFLKLAERYPQTYFGAQAREHLRQLGSANTDAVEVLDLIPAPPTLPTLNGPLPPVGAAHEERARALRSIAFDSSAEIEWRAGFAETGAARLMVNAAEAAIESGRYGAAIVMTRQAMPELEARRWEEVPLEVWRAAFPLPYSAAIRQAAGRQGLDPMLVAGLIRQESTFQSDAVSRAGAVGLMQVMPGTGKRLARALKISYSRAKLFQPEYNLKLGTRYLADLLKQLGSVEAVLAAYDAGEDRVAGWQAERPFEDIAEFVGSIPITETREYVQIVKRNAEIYRRLEAARQ